MYANLTCNPQVSPAALLTQSGAFAGEILCMSGICGFILLCFLLKNKIPVSLILCDFSATLLCEIFLPSVFHHSPNCNQSKVRMKELLVAYT